MHWLSGTSGRLPSIVEFGAKTGVYETFGGIMKEHSEFQARACMILAKEARKSRASLAIYLGEEYICHSRDRYCICLPVLYNKLCALFGHLSHDDQFEQDKFSSETYFPYAILLPTEQR